MSDLGLADTKRSKPLTARQLARLMGVSQSAVSRAFTPGSSISPELRQRILRAAEELDYHPNAIASMLSTRRSNIVGIVVSEMQNPFYPTLIEKLSRSLQQASLQSLLFNVTRGSNVEEQLAALRRYNVDAVIVISATVVSGTSLRWATEGRAAVLLNRSLPEAGLATVTCNNSAGARAIADHFHAIDRRRVAYIGGLPHTSTNLQRQGAFIQRVAELGMTLAGNISAGEYSFEAGYHAALKLVETCEPNAIFFANDILAMGGMEALRNVAERRIPEDIAVAGFDDISLGHWPRFSLTTYSQPVDKLVDATVELIKLQLSKPGHPPTTIEIDGELYVRHSSVGSVPPESVPTSHPSTTKTDH